MLFGLVFITMGCMPANQGDPEVSMDTPARITGELTFRERIILRPGTVVEVSLLDTSRADASATELAKQVIENPGAPPIPFSLEFDENAIDERLSYAVRAVVKRGDRLLLTTDSHYPVLTRGAGRSVDIMLVAPASGPSPKADATLRNTYWKLVSIRGEPYDHATANREPYIQFKLDGERMVGFTGCNQFTGSYRVDGDRLELGEIAVTRKACLEGMDVEQQYMQALRTIDAYRISGESLALLEAGTQALGFEAVYFQ